MIKRGILVTAFLVVSLVSVYAGGAAEKSVMSSDMLNYRAKILSASIAEDKGGLTGLHGELQVLAKDTKRNDYGAVLYALGLSDIALVELSFGDKTIPVMDLIGEGQDALEKAVKLLPDYSDAHRALGSLYGLIISIKGGMEGAFLGSKMTAEIKKAIKLDPENSLAYKEMAISYYYTPVLWGGDLDKAEKNIRKALSLDDKNPDVYLYLGLILAGKGKMTEGISALEEGLKLFPGHHELSRNLEELKKKQLKR
jgi:tetratricopeptide (TPR) repeat protein